MLGRGQASGQLCPCANSRPLDKLHRAILGHKGLPPGLNYTPAPEWGLSPMPEG